MMDLEPSIFEFAIFRSVIWFSCYKNLCFLKLCAFKMEEVRNIMSLGAHPEEDLDANECLI